MNPEREQRKYIGYEYKEIHAEPKYVSFYIDSYENFGWMVDENPGGADRSEPAAVRMKRDKKSEAGRS